MLDKSATLSSPAPKERVLKDRENFLETLVEQKTPSHHS